MIQIIIFSIAVFFMVLIVGIRMFEIKRDKLIIPASFRIKSDRVMWKIIKSIDLFFTKIINWFSRLFKRTLSILTHLIVDFWEFLVKKSARYINSIRGKGVLKNKGSASFFISSIVEHKEEVRNQRLDL